MATLTGADVFAADIAAADRRASEERASESRQVIHAMWKTPDRTKCNGRGGQTTAWWSNVTCDECKLVFLLPLREQIIVSGGTPYEYGPPANPAKQVVVKTPSAHAKLGSRAQVLAELDALGYRGPTSYTLTRLTEILEAQRACHT